MTSKTGTFHCSTPNALLSGQQLFIVGNAKQLGCWDYEKAIELEQRGDSETEFSASVTIPCPSEDAPSCSASEGSSVDGPLSGNDVEMLQYRYFITNRMTTGTDGDTTIVLQWEVGPPRELKLPHGAETEARDTFGVRGDYEAGGNRSLDRGWLMHTSEVRLRLYPGSVMFWKEKYTTAERLTIKAEAMDMRIRDMSVDVEADEPPASSSTDFASVTETHFCDLSVATSEKCTYGTQPLDGVALGPRSHLVFRACATTTSTLGFKFSLLKDGEAEPFGSGFLLAKHATAHRVVPIISTARPHPIGEITVDCLIIHPLAGPAQDMRLAMTRHWKHRGTVDVGHRGMGNSFNHTLAKCSIVRENTIASLRRASSQGAKYVEFDVQLSKDLVPVVYHDFTVAISLQRRSSSRAPSPSGSPPAWVSERPRTPLNFEDDHELHEIPVKDLNLSQLQLLRLSHASELNEPGRYQEYDEDNPEQLPFPTLETVFKTLSPEVGFNIEVKYPIVDKHGKSECEHYPERNVYVDRLVDCMLRHAGDRRILLSCFDPDVCSMLRLKQGRYPVLLLLETEVG